MSLNNEQQIAYNSIISNTGKSLLTAKGGCGKSYLTAKIILDKAKANTYITIVTPSHTARSVLEKQLTDQCDGDLSWGNLRHKITTMTVAGALGKRPDYSKAPDNYKDTHFTINRSVGKLRDNITHNMDRLIIIEEISMVGKSDLEEIYYQWGKAPILMVGDFRQIPPVKNKSCRSFLKEQ